MAAIVGGVTVKDEAAVAADGLGPRGQRWLLERLWPKGIHRPTGKRLAVLTAGVVATRTGQRGALSAAAARLPLSAAKEASIAGCSMIPNSIPSGCCPCSRLTCCRRG